VARNRHTDIRTLRRELRGDLDWIVMKAMEKDRTRRYGTASELAADLARYIGGRPVVARPPSALYRFTKFVRRNRTPVAAAALVVSALAVSTVLSLVSRDRALAAEAAVGREAARAQGINDFLVEVLGSPSPLEEGRSVRVADVLAKAAETASERFNGQPALEAGVRHTLGETYYRLGMYEEAEVQARAAEGLYRRLDDPFLAGTLHVLGRVLTARGEYEAAARVQDEGLAMRRNWEVPWGHWVSLDLSAIGERHIRVGQYEAAETAFREARDLMLGEPEPDEESLTYVRENLATVLYRQDKVAEAVPVFEAALESVRGRLGPDHVYVGISLNNLAIVLQRLERFDEAEKNLVEALRISRLQYEEESDHVARGLNNLGLLYRSMGRPGEGIPLLEQALAINTRVLGSDHVEVASNLQNLGLVFYDLGRFAEAADHHARALEINRRVRPGADSARSRTSLAADLMRLGRFDEAEDHFLLARAEFVRVSGEGSVRAAGVDSLMGELALRRGRPQEAEDLLLRALEAIDAQAEPADRVRRATIERLVQVQESLGDELQAERYRVMMDSVPSRP
jgi:eukaryotic-like serine/threonine-protein kinase